MEFRDNLHAFKNGLHTPYVSMYGALTVLIPSLKIVTKKALAFVESQTTSRNPLKIGYSRSINYQTKQTRG